MHRSGIWKTVRIAASIIIVFVVGFAALATVYAQKPADNPFAPSGNPFAALGAELTAISGKLDQVLKRLDAPSPSPRGPLYTGIVFRTASQGDIRCEFANVGTETLTNTEIRIIDARGVVVQQTGISILPPGFAYSIDEDYYVRARCEFSFEGSPEGVRGTIQAAGAGVLHAY